MFEFLTQHQFWAAVAIYWIFSAAVSSMPDPAPEGSPGYLWCFRFLHTVAGNITTVFGSRIPGLKSLILILAIPILLSTSACAANNYVVHPGSLNQADSVGYDSLLIAQAAIDNARAAYEVGHLPDSTKPAFNALVRSYNLAHQAWLTYRGAIQTNQPADAYFNELNQNLLNLSNALRAFEEAQ
jgi:hypothetical protein